jgi:hypothetical protein
MLQNLLFNQIHICNMCLPSFTGIRSRLISFMSWPSAVSIVTGYRLDGQGVGVQLLVELRLPPLRVVQTGFRALPASYPMGTGGSFPGGKATWACSWPLTSNLCQGQEYMDLYNHSPIPLHGIVTFFNIIQEYAENSRALETILSYVLFWMY